MPEHVVQGIVSIDQAIHDADFSPGREQFSNQAGADISRASQDQDGPIGGRAAHDGHGLRFEFFAQRTFNHARKRQGKYSQTAKQRDIALRRLLAFVERKTNDGKEEKAEGNPAKEAYHPGALPTRSMSIKTAQQENSRK